MVEGRRAPVVAALAIAIGGLLVAVGGWLEWGRFVPVAGGEPFVVRGGWLVIATGAVLALLGVAAAAVRTPRPIVVVGLAAVVLGTGIAGLGAVAAVEEGLLIRAVIGAVVLEAEGRRLPGAHDRDLRYVIDAELRRDLELGRTELRTSVGPWPVALGGSSSTLGGIVALVAAARRRRPEVPPVDLGGFAREAPAPRGATGGDPVEPSGAPPWGLERRSTDEEP